MSFLCLLVALGKLLVICEGIGSRLELCWLFSGIPWETPDPENMHIGAERFDPGG